MPSKIVPFSTRPTMILLAIVTSICLLTDMTDVNSKPGKGWTSLVNLEGDPMKISSLKNAGRLCHSELQLEYGAGLVSSVVGSNLMVFSGSRVVLYSVSMNATVADLHANKHLTVICTVKAGDFTISSLDVI